MSDLELEIQIYRLRLEGRTGITISDQLGITDLKRERLEKFVMHNKHKLKSSVFRLVMNADQFEIDSFEINRLTFAPLTIRAEQINDEVLIKRLKNYSDNAAGYDLDRLQKMLDQRKPYAEIARQYGGIGESAIGRLVSEGVLHRTNSKSLQERAEKISKDFDLERIQTMLDRGEQLQVIYRENNFTKRLMGFAVTAGLLSKDKWNSRR